jgi:branched-chain amino acid transport system permease protein
VTDERRAGDGGAVVDVEAEPSSVARHVVRIRGNERAVVGLTAVFVAVFPYLFAEAPIVSDLIFKGYRELATLILIWGIFAIGFNLLLGYTGLLSFGHAAFWGGAAYAAGVFARDVYAGPVVMLLVGTAFAVLLAWVLGYLSLRRGGIYFSILTLAFAQMFFYLASSPLAFLTGGENGLTGFDVEPLLGLISLDSYLPSVLRTLLGTWQYLFIGAIVVASVAVAYRILNSPYGMVFRAIRENEQRAEFVGLNVWRYKLMSFIVSGAFAGVAGSLYTIYNQYVPLHSLYWTTSGEVVIMAVLGGTGSLFGPLVGAGVYKYFQFVVAGGHPFDFFASYWHLMLGLTFVLVIWLFPKGIWGAIEAVRDAVVRAAGGER